MCKCELNVDVSWLQTSVFQQEHSWLSELHLDEMEKMFEDNVNAEGGLDRKTFVRCAKTVLGHVSEDMLQVLFLKVDTDCDGSITWEEYLDYVMREFQGKETKRKNQYRLRFRLPMQILPQSHRCEIVKVQYFIPRFKKSGNFITVTKDGCLQIWTESFMLISSFRLSQLQQTHHQQMWVVDMAALYNMNLIAVSSAEQKIEFYDISNANCVRVFTFVDLDSCVMVMDYWSDSHRGVFCYGDSKGNVSIFTSNNVKNGLFNPCILPKTSKWDRNPWTAVSVQKLLSEKSSAYRTFRLKALHATWCQQIKFIPEMNVVASCAAIEKTSLVLTVLPLKDSENPRFSVLGLRKGILCFDYCADKNFLVTGGYDPVISLWNPFFSKKPMWVMKGHRASVTHILVNSRDSSILFSISKDKNIRVWDMLDYICLQSFCGKLLALGNCPITSAYFHKEDNMLVCCTFSIGLLHGNLESQQPDADIERTTTHNMPLCGVLYCKNTRQVVSGCVSGTVMVWELVTGRKMAMFSVSGDEKEELTAMALDESERFLLTGLQHGSVKMWNHNNGECLLTFPNPDQTEISGIIQLNKVFYVTGWGRRINCFKFHKTKPVLLCYPWATVHTDDVLCMDKYQHLFLGTSSYNGDIFLWNISLHKPVFNFNASESYKPLQLQKVQIPEAEKAVQPQELRPRSVKKWAEHHFGEHLGHRVNPNLRRNLLSAPPVMKRPSQKDPELPVFVEKPLSAEKPKIRGTSQGMGSGGESDEGQESLPKEVQLNRAAVKIIFLQTRPRLPHMATMISSCMNGYLYAWSIHGSGGLLGKFPSDFTETGNVVVGAMDRDENDYILLTGDSKGYIKIWDIKDYCVSSKLPYQYQPVLKTMPAKNKFQYLISKRIRTTTPYFVPSKTTEVVSDQVVSLVPPNLLISWKGHEESVVDIRYVDSFQMIITAGLDRDVKTWKITGEAIGTFGLNIWKKLRSSSMAIDQELNKSYKEMPMFIDNLKTLYEEQQGDLDLASALEYQRLEQIALMALLHMKGDMEAEAWASLRKLSLQCPWGGERPLEEIESSWRMWESRAKQMRNKVLGSTRREQFRGVQYGCMQHQISPRIYQSLHFNELVSIQQPDLLQEIMDHLHEISHVTAHRSQKLDLDGETKASNISVISLPFSMASGSMEPIPAPSTLVSSLMLHSDSVSSRGVRPKSLTPMPDATSSRQSSQILKVPSAQLRKSSPVQF
ncbi:EF-hand calcium-binding domain-containing protein 8 [Suncus etruscus]|uniref:EF-hand calcium-binding domain-containing protein 8 n=1 Tax=Suncus etruscus TaxID=109475 RepID=UPI00210F3B93|nr:EF-hand calcium-binding domain-containing protein 8 [Suncus etruscus]